MTLYPAEILRKNKGYDSGEKILLKLFMIPSRSNGMHGHADTIFFHSITVAVPNKGIYSRLGFRKDHTRIPPEHLKMVEAYISEALELIELKGAARILGIEANRGADIYLSTGSLFRSEQLAGMTSGCTEMLLMGATAGSRIMEEINRDTTTGNITRGVVLDAVASEMTDEALAWIMGYVSQDLRRRAKRLTRRRFSAGYGDFSLANQKIMYDLLQMDNIGVRITKEYLLVPEKSVTAIAGIHPSGQ